MKKLFAFFLFILPFYLTAQTYHIKNVNYFIDSTGTIGIGRTSEYALSQAVPVDSFSVFSTEDELQDYIKKLFQELQNTRAFDQIEITYSILETIEFNNEVNLEIHVKDTSHLLALPHVIGYNSNEGWNPKLKAKDSNFLGSLNTMSAELFGLVPIASDNKNYSFGAEIDFKLPFKLSIFDSELINDYTLSYSLEDPTPEWETKTGLKVSLPFENYKYQFEVYQYANRDYDYSEYGDSTYFTEEADFSIPFTIASSNTYGKLTYTPKLNFTYNWDLDSINILNNDLYSPYVYLQNAFSLDNVNWFGNYRKGFNLEIKNTNYYYFQRHDLIPYISFESNYYNYLNITDSNWFNKIGVAARIITFNHFNTNDSNYYYGIKIGSKLRGIRDKQTALTTSGVFLVNMDFPLHIWTTDFNTKLLRIFNCEIQFSPFLDMAICNNQITETIFNPKDGFYAAGFEVLVYPKKWSSFTVRGSLGYDLSRSLFKDFINTDWRQKVKKYEISLGLGLQY